MRRTVVRKYWKHNVAEDMQVLLVMQEGKEAMFLCAASSSLSLILHSSSCVQHSLHLFHLAFLFFFFFLHARVSFLEWGLLPSRESISLTAWGVSWESTWQTTGNWVWTSAYFFCAYSFVSSFVNGLCNGLGAIWTCTLKISLRKHQLTSNTIELKAYT